MRPDRMTEADEGRTSPDYDHLIDTVADACAGDDPTAVARLCPSTTSAAAE
ncbi:hypothetical protein AB0M61_44945 [Streptomyces sp. NPDC051642]|uniref:hypothetical protein n=1 Tax=Streptomyces sp. NPDC051642 TaxID=3154646 RepID=UPI003431C064